MDETPIIPQSCQRCGGNIIVEDYVAHINSGSMEVYHAECFSV